MGGTACATGAHVNAARTVKLASKHLLFILYPRHSSPVQNLLKHGPKNITRNQAHAAEPALRASSANSHSFAPLCCCLAR